MPITICHMRQYASVFLLVIFSLCLPVAYGAAQEAGEAVVLAQSASPTELKVGEEAWITFTLTGQEAGTCMGTEPQQADIVLVMDVSTSMDDEDKLAAAQRAALQFIANVDLSTDQVAVVAFSDTAFTVQGLTQRAEVARRAIESLSTIDGTDIAAGLSEAVRVLSGGARRPSATANIVLLSDGQSDWTPAQQSAEQAKEQGIAIYTISLGSDADQVLMQNLASSSLCYYHAPTAADLVEIYETIRVQIEAAKASNVILHTIYDDAMLELVSDSLSPMGIVSGNHITWTLDVLAPGQQQTLSFRVRTTRAGEFPSTLSTDVSYILCGDQQYSLAHGPGPTLIVTDVVVATPIPVPTVSPCADEPLSNDCISSLLCLGGLTWPCTVLGLPWWVCLLLLLLPLLALLLWVLWRRREQARKAWRHPQIGAISAPGLDTGRWAPIPQPSVPPTLPLACFKFDARLNPTLVIGLGGTGAGVLQTLRETLREAYGDELPPTVRLLAIDTEPAALYPEPADSLSLPVDASVHRLFAQLGQADEGFPNSHSQQDGGLRRMLCRLALVAHRHKVEERLAAELKAFCLKPDDRLTIYIVASLAGATGSGLLADIAHLVRRQAQALEVPSFVVHGLLVLPEAHSMGIDLAAMVKLQRTAAAAWRELDRFQLVFEHAYPISYGKEVTWRKGKLFERCYLFSTDREGKPSLGGIPLEWGLYPAIADVIVALADPTFHNAWEVVAQAVSERLNRRQYERQEALYESLGVFTYILPVKDLVETVALRLVGQMLDGQQEGGLSEARAQVIAFLSQSASPSGVPNTALIRDLAQRVEMPPEQAISQANAMSVELAALLSPFPGEETTQETLTVLRGLASTGLLEAVQTSIEARAGDYGKDVARIFDEVGQVRERLSALEPYLQACAEGQRVIFQRLLVEHLTQLLNPNPTHESPKEYGPVVGCDFLQVLEEVVAAYQDLVNAVVQGREAALREEEAQAQKVREALQKAAEGSRLRHPRLRRALLSGLIPAGAVVVGLGLAGLALPTLSTLLGGVAALAVAGGAWLSWRALFRKPQLVRLQAEYLIAEQSRLRAEIEVRLCTAWSRIVEEWSQIVQRTREPLARWQDVLAQIKVRAEERAAALAERRQARRAICVRKYLDDIEIEEALYRRYIAPLLKEDLRTRFVWRYADDNTWRLSLYGSQPWEVDYADAEMAEAAMLDIGRAYGSVLRSLQIADVLAELCAPQAIAEECGPGSAPLIRTVPYEQPISEAHRFVGIAGGGQSAHFEQVLQHLRAPVAQVHSEQLAHIQHPHRCVALASLDLLRTRGLPSWSQAREAYREIRSQKRAALQVFPAETNAVLYEGLLSEIGLALRFFSPYTCLTLEDERRARAFWLAYAYGWVRVNSVERGGRAPLLQMVLALPEMEPAPLTEARDEPPSLWEAAVTFVLAEQGDLAETVEAALEGKGIGSSNGEARRAAMVTLGQALERARALQENRDTRKQELGIVMHLVVEDALRRLEGQPAFLG